MGTVNLINLAKENLGTQKNFISYPEERDPVSLHLS